MNKIALLWPNRIDNYDRLRRGGVQVFENVGVLTAASLTKQLVNEGFQAFVCTGGIENEVRRVTNLPLYVVTSGYIDMLESFKSLETDYHISGKQVALLIHENNFLQMERIAPYIKNYVERFTFSRSDEIPRLFRQIIHRGFDAVVTGPTGLTYAEQEDIPAFPICYSEETALDAVKQVSSLIDLSRREILRTKQIQGAIDVSPDPILSTDSEGLVTLCNQKACEILHLSQDQILGHPIVEVMSDPTWESVYKDGVAQRGVLTKIHKDSYFSTRLPIRQEQRVIGSVGTLQAVEQIRSLETKFRSLQSRGLTAKHFFSDIVGTSPRLREVVEQAKIFAETDLTILLEGETGTGKEIFAQSIHNASSRRHGPFVAINCAALTESLLESELMGYEEGSFTGAKKGGKAGLFELAHNGTLFLDEINQMSLPLQSKLLRVIQERTVMRIGGDRMIPINVRIIAAANEKLQNKVSAGQFRSDLYYRINIMHLTLPALRDRPEDIPLLIRSFAGHGADPNETEQYLAKLYKEVEHYTWPGNIRELQNYVWRSTALLSHGVSLTSRYFDEYHMEEYHAKSPAAEHELCVSIAPMEDMECEIVEKLFQRYDGNQSEVARVLKLSRNTVSSKLGRRGT